MAAYLDAYNVVIRAKRDGKSRPPTLVREVRLNIETALMGTRIRTIFDSPLESRLWREFQAACRRLDRSKRVPPRNAS